MPFIGPTEMLRAAPLPGWAGRFFHSENMTFGCWVIADGAADLHEHDHPQEEVWNVVDGAILLIVGGEERRLGPGDAAVIPPGSDTPPGPSVPVAPSSSTIRFAASFPGSRRSGVARQS
ncbi:MAG TPA: cupin domain-containing protein, partial [Solirubrobacteraceae bacterium]|nr:cupin domain-containing protein [Solirubrobacteraceae bacterium]